MTKSKINGGERMITQQTEAELIAQEIADRVDAYYDAQRREGDFTETYTGVRFYACDPRPYEVVLEDIAHALSMLCRFGGHASQFYSVAQHSAITAFLLNHNGESPFVQLLGLAHDFTEAYIADLPTPLKRNLPEYVAIENPLFDVIWQSFGLRMPTAEEHAKVKAVDTALMQYEACRLGLNKTEWATDQPFGNVLVPESPLDFKPIIITLFNDIYAEVTRSKADITNVRN
jgi:hypothetical protein